MKQIQATFPDQPPANQGRPGIILAKMKRAGGLVFTFFLLKGLVWLSLPIWMWLGFK